MRSDTSSMTYRYYASFVVTTGASAAARWAWFNAQDDDEAMRVANRIAEKRGAILARVLRYVTPDEVDAVTDVEF